MSCTKLAPYDRFDLVHQMLREGGTICHLNEQNNDFVRINLSSSSNAESILNIWEMLKQDIVDLRAAESYTCWFKYTITPAPNSVISIV